MASPVRHIDMGRRKALHVKFEALRALPPRIARDETGSRRRKDLLDDICARANGLWDDDRALDDSLRHLGASLERLSGKWTGTELQQAWDTLTDRLRSFDCARCAGEQACTGDERDHAVVAAHGACLSPLAEVLERVLALCTVLHEGLGAAVPAVMLATGPTGENNDAGMLDRFSIAGWHKVHDRATSIVGLDLRDRHFDDRSMAGLLYTVLHELVCHAFQQVGDGGRENCLPTCPWSEGWMDGFAIELAAAWLETHTAALPDWIADRAEHVLRISRDMHSQRYEPSRNLSDNDAKMRWDAAVAYQRLRAAWSCLGPLETNRVAAFTVALNATPIPPRQRKRLGLDLAMLFSRKGTAAFNETVGLCSRFALRDLSFPEFDARVSQLAKGSTAAC